MNAIEQIIAEVEELDAKATKGPFRAYEGHYLPEGEIWIKAPDPTQSPDEDSYVSIAAVRRGCEEAGDDEQNKVDAEMFATYRTAAPRLARALKKALEALEKYAAMDYTLAQSALATITTELTK